jgi:hypothetical protein
LDVAGGTLPTEPLQLAVDNDATTNAVNAKTKRSCPIYTLLRDKVQLRLAVDRAYPCAVTSYFSR